MHKPVNNLNFYADSSALPRPVPSVGFFTPSPGKRGAYLTALGLVASGSLTHISAPALYTTRLSIYFMRVCSWKTAIMQKSVNKIMYYPLRDDIPCSTLCESKARAVDKRNQIERTEQ